ncbi:hypothetical protein [Streptomyces sp. NPDC052494]|uniref:hypothetical protein n=1 Tax=Streptomyces sp. NPDC052494 TaxID=3365692 RepID=UPI0037D0AF41
MDRAFDSVALLVPFLVETTTMDVESLFLDLYDSVADRADYAQSDSAGRQFLPETVITTLTAPTLGAFVTGFTQAFGEKMTQGTADRIRALLRRSAGGLGETGGVAADRSFTEPGGQPEQPADGSAEPAAEALRLLDRYLPLLRESTREQRADAEGWVARELQERSFPPHVAAAVAADMVGRLRTAGGTGGRRGQQLMTSLGWYFDHWADRTVGAWWTRRWVWELVRLLKSDDDPVHWAKSAAAHRAELNQLVLRHAATPFTAAHLHFALDLVDTINPVREHRHRAPDYLLEVALTDEELEHASVDFPPAPVRAMRGRYGVPPCLIPELDALIKAAAVRASAAGTETDG